MVLHSSACCSFDQEVIHSQERSITELLRAVTEQSDQLNLQQEKINILEEKVSVQGRENVQSSSSSSSSKAVGSEKEKICLESVILFILSLFGE